MVINSERTVGASPITNSLAITKNDIRIGTSFDISAVSSTKPANPGISLMSFKIEFILYLLSQAVPQSAISFTLHEDTKPSILDAVKVELQLQP